MRAAIEETKPVHLRLPIHNVHRAVGAGLSGRIVQRCGAAGLPEDTIRLDFSGSAGQSLGAFLAPGITIRVKGDANDYLGKGMSGGRIILVPPKGMAGRPHENIIVGNTVLYGATGGEAYLSGLAGDAVAGASLVVRAIDQGRRMADAVDRFLHTA